MRELRLDRFGSGRISISYFWPRYLAPTRHPNIVGSLRRTRYSLNDGRSPVSTCSAYLEESLEIVRNPAVLKHTSRQRHRLQMDCWPGFEILRPDAAATIARLRQ